MGHRRPHALLLGLAVLSAALSVAVIFAEPGASSAGSSSVVHGAVASDGAVRGEADGWRVQRLEPGVYRLEFDGGDVRVEVERWDAIADAAVVPLSAGTDLIRFRDPAGALDTSFSFTAIVSH
jgi:hypothetical protein